MARSAETWIRAAFKNRIRALTPTDKAGDTVVWNERDIVDSGGNVIAHVIHHTYVADLIAGATATIEDDKTFPTDAAVHEELKRRGLEPE